MCKNKKIIAMLLGLVMTISLSGCAEGSASLVTDTGSGQQQDIPLEDYLKTDVLDDSVEQTVENLYKVLTLEKTTFEEQALNQILRRSYLNVPTVNFTLEGIKAYFGGYAVQPYQYVEEGDLLATVYTEVDELALQELRIKLQRLEERYQSAQEQVTETLEDHAYYANYSPTVHQCWLRQMQYEQTQLDWEYQKYNYESQIADVREELEKLTKVGSSYEIYAPMSGYVVYHSRYAAGKEMKEGDYICNIMNSTVVYTATDSQADQLHYGMDIDFNSQAGMTPSEVVNGGSWLLYGNLDTGEAIFRLDFEQDISELSSSVLNNLVLKGNLKTVENVIVIPKAAVEMTDAKEYFVTVLKEDGSLLKTEFIPGGSNVESYWVLSGLTEGMKIVYN
uniref:efflux RND transporter periplasmic adaptor subunit n=1 Tax=Acetatifactor sp. TaxID=1872090 RepID=UPI00405653E2